MSEYPGDQRFANEQPSRATLPDHDLRVALHGLVATMMREADECDRDGDYCCALTRRHDAVAILAVMGEVKR